MKTFFTVVLALSVITPVYWLITDLTALAHNQCVNRPLRLKDTRRPDMPSSHLGLTGGQLVGVDEMFSDSYKNAVNDGYDVAIRHENFFAQAVAIDGLLFVTALLGLRICRVQLTQHGLIERKEREASNGP